MLAILDQKEPMACFSCPNIKFGKLQRRKEVDGRSTESLLHVFRNIDVHHYFDSDLGSFARLFFRTRMKTTEPNQALEPTTLSVTLRAPSRTDRAS